LAALLVKLAVRALGLVALVPVLAVPRQAPTGPLVKRLLLVPPNKRAPGRRRPRARRAIR